MGRMIEITEAREDIKEHARLAIQHVQKMLGAMEQCLDDDYRERRGGGYDGGGRGDYGYGEGRWEERGRGGGHGGRYY